MTVTQLLKDRTSIRAYLDKPVEEEKVRSLLEAARWAPSGGNLQPWKVVVVSGEARDEIVKLAVARMMANPQGEAGDYPVYPHGLGEPYRSRRFQAGEAMYAKLGLTRDDKAGRMQWLVQNFSFFGAPIGIFFVIDKQMGHNQWAHLGMFMQSLALLAQEDGLATCMQEAWAMVRESLRAPLGLEDDELLYCGMALGYRDLEAPVNQVRSERADVDEFAKLKGF